MLIITDTLGNELELKTENDLIFYEMVLNNYDYNDIRIKGKLYHTYRVANHALNIAKILKINEELAYNIGLLHDYSRFYQWEKYKSFEDHKTIDHGDMASSLLFESNEINQFLIDPSTHEIINIAIKNHNKKDININKNMYNKNQYEEILLFSKLIRDADKMDILYRLSKGDIYLEYKIPGASKKVLESLKNHQCVDKKYMTTSLDKLLTIIGYIYDFNLDESLSCIDFPSLWDGVINHYGRILSKEDYKTLNEVINIVNDYTKNIQTNKK